jgi:hypothetical protein
MIILIEYSTMHTHLFDNQNNQSYIEEKASIISRLQYPKDLLVGLQQVFR